MMCGRVRVLLYSLADDILHATLVLSRLRLIRLDPKESCDLQVTLSVTSFT